MSASATADEAVVSELPDWGRLAAASAVAAAESPAEPVKAGLFRSEGFKCAALAAFNSATKLCVPGLQGSPSHRVNRVMVSIRWATAVSHVM